MNDKLKADISKILQAFANAEAGNRITQFNMGGLANMLMGVIDGTIVVQDGQAQGQGIQPPVNFPTAQIETPLENKEIK
jgi:hypothetical protein